MFSFFNRRAVTMTALGIGSSLLLWGCASSAPLLSHDQSGAMVLGDKLDDIETFIKDAQCLKFDDQGEPTLQQCPAEVAALLLPPEGVELSGLPIEHHRGYFTADLNVELFKDKASSGLIYLHDTLLFGGARFRIGDFAKLATRQQHDLKNFCEAQAREARWAGVVEEVFAGCSYNQTLKSESVDKSEVRMSTLFEREARAGTGNFLERDPEAPWDHEGRLCDQKAAVSVSILTISDLCRDHVKEVVPSGCQVTLNGDTAELLTIENNGVEVRRSCDGLLGAEYALLTASVFPSVTADPANFRKGDGTKQQRRISLEFADAVSWKTHEDKSWSWNGRAAISKEGAPLVDTAISSRTVQLRLPVDPATGEFAFKIRASECTWGKAATCSLPGNLAFRVVPTSAPAEEKAQKK